MGSKYPSLTFALTDPLSIQEAFAFHQTAISMDSRIVLRAEQDFQEFADDQRLFAVADSSGELVAQCYVGAFEDREWELGGLFVNSKLRGFGVAGALIAFAIAHTVIFVRPWFDCEEIVAYIEAGNAVAQNSALRSGFMLQGEVLPINPGISTKTNSLVYRRYLLPRSSLRGVITTFDTAFVPRQSPFKIKPAKLRTILKKGLGAAIRDIERGS